MELDEYLKNVTKLKFSCALDKILSHCQPTILDKTVKKFLSIYKFYCYSDTSTTHFVKPGLIKHVLLV